MRLADLIMPAYLRRVMGVTRVELDAASRARLEALRGQRVMLTPNHPSYEPAVLYKVSRQLGLRFCWLAAREVFEQWQQGWLVGRVGAYSVDRAVRDEQSLSATRRILCEGRDWLVLFPEGQEYYLHDTLLPFLPGAARAGFEALDELRASGSDAPLYIVPVALRYFYDGDMRLRMDAILRELELKLGLPSPRPGPDEGLRSWLHGRLSAVADHVLDANESLYGLPSLEDGSISERLSRLRETIMERAADALGAPRPDLAQPLRNRLRKLMVAANAVVHSRAADEGVYAQDIHSRRVRRALRIKEDLRRVIGFVALTDAYALEVPTVERLMDTLGRLEVEVLGRLRFYPPRIVRVVVGEPIDLGARFADWQARGEDCAEALTAELEAAVRGLLAGTAELMTTLGEQGRPVG
jgi:1-acyl-sn-glycerol-3-phosphate acyltransferase